MILTWTDGTQTLEAPVTEARLADYNEDGDLYELAATEFGLGEEVANGNAAIRDLTNRERQNLAAGLCRDGSDGSEGF